MTAMLVQGLFGKLIHLWVRNTRDMEIIPQVPEIMPAVHAGKLCPGGHILIQEELILVKSFWHGAFD